MYFFSSCFLCFVSPAHIWNRILLWMELLRSVEVIRSNWSKTVCECFDFGGFQLDKKKLQRCVNCNVIFFQLVFVYLFSRWEVPQADSSFFSKSKDILFFLSPSMASWECFVACVILCQNHLLDPHFPITCHGFLFISYVCFPIIQWIQLFHWFQFFGYVCVLGFIYTKLKPMFAFAFQLSSPLKKRLQTTFFFVSLSIRETKYEWKTWMDHTNKPLETNHLAVRQKKNHLFSLNFRKKINWMPKRIFFFYLCVNIC